VALNRGIAAGRTVRQSGRLQSGIHHFGGHKSGRRKQVAMNARPGTICGDHKHAQLCFACRLRAKVSSFPLADRLAERMRAVQITR
jgi:hypothetical protein